MSDALVFAITHRLELIVDAPARGEENMRRDLALLDACARGEIPGAVRLYGFFPACLSLGRMQPIDDVNLEACARDGVDVVRRPSGGRAVLHDQEVTYSVVCRSTDPVFGGRVLESCSRIHEAVAVGLATLGLHVTPRALPANLRRDAREGAAASLIALRAPPHTSCLTTVVASWSAARRQGVPARCYSTDRCCSSPRARPATCALIPCRHSAASDFGSCSVAT